jgi:2-polyprenyl-3-methyl-5-hydroxy-6-metoxy-1,4-benzoquinol methylase
MENMGLRMKCRICNEVLRITFANLKSTPLANSLLNTKELLKKENTFPLHAYVCEKCFLVQVEELEKATDIFSDYVYFSSYSDSWLKHAENYVETITNKFSFNEHSQIIEIASNDGYLLQYFLKKNVKILGIEPSNNVAIVAEEKGIPTLKKFFGEETALQIKNDGKAADLIIGNNVLAHVPDLSGFVKGLKVLLKPEGIITIEFPHLLQLILQTQFDTIYHEHFSYFSLFTVIKIFSKYGLEIFDVEELETHGGSLRIYVKHEENEKNHKNVRIDELLKKEEDNGLKKIKTYEEFGKNIEKLKEEIVNCLVKLNNDKKKIVGYGAPAKGNTLLNYFGIDNKLIQYTVDRNPHKQGKFLPGTHIPIKRPEEIELTKPDYILILPWNLKNEIMKQLQFVKKWQCKFIVPIPSLKII